MDLVDPINLPGETIIDPVTGYAINVPVTQQGWPRWWIEMPEAYEHILKLRLERGILVNDGIQEWEEMVKAARDADV